MDRPLEDHLLEYFILHDMGGEDLAMVRRVRREHGKINCKGNTKLGKINCVAKEPYNKWVKEMA